MYLYFDRNRVLKEIINNDAISVGDTGSQIYIYVEELEPNQCWVRFKLPDGSLFPISAEMQVTKTVTTEIPYNEKRDLKFFKYGQSYKFLIVDLTKENPDGYNILSTTGNISCTVRINDNGLKALGLIVFNVTYSTEDEVNQLEYDGYVSIAQFDYLLELIERYEGTIIVVDDVSDLDVDDYAAGQIFLQYNNNLGCLYYVKETSGVKSIRKLEMEFEQITANKVIIATSGDDEGIAITNQDPDAPIIYVSGQVPPSEPPYDHMLNWDLSIGIDDDSIFDITQDSSFVIDFPAESGTLETKSVITIGTGVSGTLTTAQLALAQKDNAILIKSSVDFYYKVTENSTQIVFKRAIDFDDAQPDSINTDVYMIIVNKSTRAWNLYLLNFEFYTKSGTDNAIQTAINSLGTVLNYKGSLTVAQINALTGQVAGDVYNVSDGGTITAGSITVVAGDNVVWTSNNTWDKLAGTIDLSGYLQKTSTTSVVYATDGSGNTTYVPYSSGATSGRLVQRVENGNINVPETPTNSTHAASKGYADTKLPKVAYSSSLNISSLPNEGVFTGSTSGKFHKVVSGSSIALHLETEESYYYLSGMDDTYIMQEFFEEATRKAYAFKNVTNNFSVPQFISSSTSNGNPLSLSSEIGSTLADGCYIGYYVNDQYWTYAGEIGVKNKKPAFRNNNGVDDYLVLESDFNELKAMFYETTVDVQDYNLTYATYSALPTSLSSQPIIFSAGTDVVELKGRSYVVNQLAKELNATNWFSVPDTLTFDNEVATVVPASGNIYPGLSQFTENIVGHIYLICVQFKGETSLNLNFAGYDSSIATGLNASVFNFVAKIITASNTTDRISFFVLNGTNTQQYQKPIVIDLTQWFGSNDNIPADLLTTPSLFLTKYWKGDLPYNTGTIVDSKPNKLISYGANLLNNTNVTLQNQGLQLHPKLEIGKTYTFSIVGGTSTGDYSIWLSKDGSTVQDLGSAHYYNSITFTVASDFDYMGFYPNNVNGVNLMLNIGSTALPYTPYITPSETPITSNVLRSAGSVQDTNEKVNIGVVDLGDLTWEYVDEAYIFKANIPNGLSQPHIPSLCSKYLQTTLSLLNLDKVYVIYSAPTGFNLYVKDTSGPQSSATDFKSYVSGTKLNYELLTPTDQNPVITLPENITIQKGGSVEIQYASGYETPCDITFEMATNKLVEE